MDDIAPQNQKAGRHDRKATKLPKRPEPEIGNALPADGAFVVIRFEAQKRTEGRDQHGQGHHHRNQSGRHRKLHDHHAVQSAKQHNTRHTNRDLEQAQPQDLIQRQTLARGIREGQISG